MTTYEELHKTYEACEKALDYDLFVRLRRSLSWLQRAVRETDDIDASFIFHWISFNAAYAGGYSKNEEHREASAFNIFFKKLVRHDTDKKIHSLICYRLIDELNRALNNEHIFDNFWREDKLHKSNAWSEAFKKSNERASIARNQKETTVILSILFQRIYVLRNQMFHGSATWQGIVNRRQVIDC